MFKMGNLSLTAHLQEDCPGIFSIKFPAEDSRVVDMFDTTKSFQN